MNKSKIYDTLHLVKTLTFLRVVNFFWVWLTYFVAKYFKLFIVPSGPLAASVEPTTSCNLRCPECPSGLRILNRPKGFIKPEKFDKWAAQLSPTVAWVNFYFQGEPLLHQSLGDLLKIARKQKFYTSISTNGHFLSEENCKILINKKLCRLIISLDGLDQESYSRYRRGGDFSAVMEGIERITRLKKEMKSSYPFIEVQFLVFKSNEHQIKGIKQMEELKLVDSVKLKTAQFYNPDEASDLIPDNQSYSRYKKNEDGGYVIKSILPNHCIRLWSSVVITWDGKVLPCCYDKDGTFLFGDMEVEKFSSIWHGKERKKFASKLFKNRSSIEICRNCDQGLKLTPNSDY